MVSALVSSFSGV